jgi:hypothetical protein
VKITDEEADFMVSVVNAWLNTEENSPFIRVRNKNCCTLCIEYDVRGGGGHIWLIKRQGSSLFAWNFSTAAANLIPSTSSPFDGFCEINRKLISPLLLLTLREINESAD